MTTPARCAPKESPAYFSEDGNNAVAVRTAPMRPPGHRVETTLVEPLQVVTSDADTAVHTVLYGRSPDVIAVGVDSEGLLRREQEQAAVETGTQGSNRDLLSIVRQILTKAFGDKRADSLVSRACAGAGVDESRVVKPSDLEAVWVVVTSRVSNRAIRKALDTEFREATTTC